MTPPGAAPLGLYESTDSGGAWTQVINEPQDPVDGSSANGNDFFRGGVTKVEFDPRDPATSYAAVSDYGLFRRLAGQSTYTRSTRSTPRAASPCPQSRIEFDAHDLGGKTRIYLGDATFYNNSAGLLRTNDATAPTVSWTSAQPEQGHHWLRQLQLLPGPVQLRHGRHVTARAARHRGLSGSMNYDEIFTAPPAEQRPGRS